ncbi:MAG: Lactate utilization protein [Bacillales bacterium]|jgi:L-lactate dehydrogenase complex protein LldE|nr:Lactate utilization protein [Bacillales bacterium]
MKNVSLFTTCIVDVYYPQVGVATIELLESLGCKVDVPTEQTCCGQPAFNSGYVKDSKKAMRNMIKVFENSEYVVSPSGSCAFMFKEYPHIFDGEPEWKARAEKLAAKTYELTQFLVNVLGVDDIGARLEGKGTYHTSCHMTRLLGVKEEPFKLLAKVSNLDMIPLPDADRCCGFGGTFAVKMADISEQVVDEKAKSIISTGANYLIGADAGCLLNIAGRLQRLGREDIKVLHIAEVLNSK